MRRKPMGWSLLPKIMDGKHEKEEEEEPMPLLFFFFGLLDLYFFFHVYLVALRIIYSVGK